MKSKKKGKRIQKPDFEQLLDGSRWKEEVLLLPSSVRKLGLYAYEAYDKENLRGMENYTKDILNTGISSDLFDLRKKLAELLFRKEFYEKAEDLLRDLLKENQSDTDLLSLLGLCCFSQEKFEDTTDIMERIPDFGDIPKQYRIKIYYVYSTSLVMLDREEESIQVMRKMLDELREHHGEHDAVSGNGEFIIPYGNILLYDIEKQLDFQNDLEEFRKYLESVEMTGYAQHLLMEFLISFDMDAEEDEVVGDTLKKLLDHISKKGYFTEKAGKKVMEDCYHHLERSEYEKDNVVHTIFKAFLNDEYDYKDIEFTSDPEKKYYQRLYGLSARWYCARYADEFPESFEQICRHISEHYPVTWNKAAQSLREMKTELHHVMDRTEKELLIYSKTKDIGQFREELQKNYEKMLNGETELF